jgi:Family of unknown function (DUF6152)
MNKHVAAIGLGMTLTLAPLMAHHSFAAEYDSKKPVLLKGTVTKVDWMNPHVYFYLDVEDDSGNVANWSLEMGPPNGLQLAGWTRNTMKVGDVVVVEGTMAKDGAHQANARAVTMATTGKRLGAASSEGNIP